MVKSPDQCVTKMKNVLTVLNDVNRVRGGAATCDDVVREFQEFLETVVVEKKATYSGFDPRIGSDQNRVDVLLHHDMGGDNNYQKLWRIVKGLLLLSHGQASVERGFSINKEIEVENLKEESHVAQRVICDHLSAVGGVRNVVLSRQLLMSASSALRELLREAAERKVERERVEKKKKNSGGSRRDKEEKEEDRT
jgi:hypothetical protein